MKQWFVRIAPLAFAVMQFGCSDAPKPAMDTRAADEKAIRDGEVQWVKDFASKDADKGASHYADDASFLLTGMPIVTGKDAIRNVYRDMFTDPNLAVDFSASKVEVAKLGDLAYSQGSYTMTSTNPKTKKAATEKGKYLTIYKKQADGTWRAQQDMMNADAPAVAEKTGKAAKTDRTAKVVKKAKKGRK